MAYKIVLADDHQLLLQGIHAVIKEIQNVEIAGEASNGLAALELVAKHSPDMLVLDLNMPQYDGLKTLKIIKKDFPNVRVLVLSNYQQPELIRELKQLGADGYLNKNSTSTELREAIESVLAGNHFFPSNPRDETPAEDSYYFDDFLKKYQLTKREVQIIRMICQGLSTKEIAQSLYLSEFTISTHRKNIFRKVDTRNTAELIHFARENQLIA